VTAAGIERKRILFLFIVFCVWVLVVGASLVKIQVVDYVENVKKVQGQSTRTESLIAKRGTIYDRNGEILAISVKTQSAFISNRDPEEALTLLTEVKKSGIMFNTDEIRNIKKRIIKGNRFIWLKRKLTDDEFEILKDIKEAHKKKDKSPIIDFVEEYRRVYPQGNTASHILGGVGIDEQGLGGIEFHFNPAIAGKGGIVQLEQDARRKTFDLQYIEKPEEGKDIYLTIDASIQYFVEKELKMTLEKYSAPRGCVIVMNTGDGSILAMASSPDYSPEKIAGTPPAFRKNNAVSFIYHPGSTFKVLMVASALDFGICAPQEEFFCWNGEFKIKDRSISDVHPYSYLTVEGIVINSSNIGAALIGARMGKYNVMRAINNFKLGQLTGIELPGEERGIVNPVKTWSGISVYFIAYGYEVAVTPIQMIGAFNVIATNGYLLQPHIIKKIEGVYLKKEQPRPIISSGTAHRMTSIMTQVVKSGTGKSAYIEEVPVAAKTGTTKRINRSQGHSEGLRYISSFGGFFPAQNPQITMFVLVDEPKGLYYGGDVAAPLFKTIAEKLIIYLGISPAMGNKTASRL